MVELWIPITLAAAFLQNLRSMLQKRARSDLSVNGASYTRFVFALPFVWLYLAWLADRAPLPEVNGVFLAWCLLVLGVLSGTGFAAASVGYRAAALSLPAGDFLTRSGYTLAVTVTMQALIMGAYIAWRETDELGRVFRSWQTSIWVGLLGASACWFSAMTLTNAGLVRALGQVELLFTFVASIWFFGERVSANELAGALLVILGLWLLLI